MPDVERKIKVRAEVYYIWISIEKVYRAEE